MTVKYCDKVASRGGFGSFFKLLLRWRGSVYKMVWQDMLAYVLVYYFISFIYRFALDEVHQKNFESFVLHCNRFRNLIPVSFVLGFYVSLVVNRWWGTYQSLPWPDNLAIAIGTYIPGKDMESKNIRLLVMRYVNYVIAVTFTMISPSVKCKLPTLQHFIVAGYLTEEERLIMERLENRTKLHKTWIPIQWACKLVTKARIDGLILSDGHQRILYHEIMALKGQCGGLLGWAEYNIPLVYTQVVTIAVYSFFIFSLVGEQFLEPAREYPGHAIDLYIPIFALLQIFFYIGWVKVAEALLNPFGSDDHDWEFNSLLERHVEMSALLAEGDQTELPSCLLNTDEESLAYTTCES